MLFRHPGIQFRILNLLDLIFRFSTVSTWTILFLDTVYKWNILFVDTVCLVIETFIKFMQQVWGWWGTAWERMRKRSTVAWAQWGQLALIESMEYHKINWHVNGVHFPVTQPAYSAGG